MSKNILVVGAGTPNKFGQQFVKKAREKGNRVIVFSHKNHNTSNVDDRYINYNDANQVKSKCVELCNELPVIDIILFNQLGSAYPDSAIQLFDEPNIAQYNQTVASAAGIPHLIIAVLYNNLIVGSKVVYMGSTMALEYEREYYVSGVGYPSAKSFAMHLMSSMARCRTKEVTFSSMCPYFLYDQPESYKQTFEQTYNYILTHDDSVNGKLVHQFNGVENPYVPGKINYTKQ
jgi:hypothetical protein